MSFKFNWGGFPPAFNEEALAMLTQALNKGGNKPPNLVGPITAKELDLGSIPPQLDILEISELEEDRFRAMFRMKYEGDGYLVLQTQVQANPLRLPTSELPTMPSIGVVAAAQPLVVPMLLRISGLKLHGIVVLAVSKVDGITLVFRSDPLVSVEVHSTFDSVPSVRRMLQREIEATLRTLFQEDLPIIVHDMSVNEIRRARELKERERREHIEKQQKQIRLQHARVDSMGDMWTSAARGSDIVGTDSGAASAGSMTRSISQHLMASQLHQRLMELSREEKEGRIGQHCADAHSDSGYTHVFDSRTGDDADSYSHKQWQQLLETKSQGQAYSMSDRFNMQTPSPLPSQPHRHSDSGHAEANNVYPESLERFLNEDWERLQQSTELETYQQRREEEKRALEEQQNGVILRPSDNAVAARLASLMNMGQTLSPYTRRFEHTTLRSDVNPRSGYFAYRNPSRTTGTSDPPHFDVNSVGSPPPSHSLSPGSSFVRHDSMQLPSSAGVLASTPFSTTSPPSGGVRSPFARNRTLRRKIHRIGGISLGKGAVGQ
ncbi:ERMES complex subunit [Coemansia sp. RSA 988]|nr:ERMES complex subunit [Coemansia sp. RSA 988]